MLFNLSLNAKGKDIFDFFESQGEIRVRDVKLITDKITGRSKGFAYVEFYDPSSMTKALVLNGVDFFGQPLKIKLSEADRNITTSNMYE